jgi:hypothetical protein
VKNVVSGVINLLSTLQEQIRFPERKGGVREVLKKTGFKGSVNLEVFIVNTR